MEAEPFVTTLPGATGPPQEGVAVPAVAGYDGLELVGRGGMGKVYRAHHITLGRIVALKVLAHEPDERMLARFAEEARAVARLHHPNICPLFETGTVEGRPWFAQEFLDGGSLAQKLGGVPQDPHVAAGLVETIAHAVQYSHENGILHRDLKPGNILLAGDGTLKVTDFGLAKVLAAPGTDSTQEAGGGLTRTGEIVGTPGYMPPEQASGVVTGLGPATDVYALGAILYEALTGRPPFQAPDALQTLLMVLAMDPVSPRVLQPKVPRDLETICLKCLEKAPKRRYATARELAEDLGRFREGRPILARPVGFFERTAKWAKRNKSEAALVALSFLLGLAIIGFGVLQTLSAMRQRQANRDLASAKTSLEETNAELEGAKKNLEATNANLLAAKSESDQSYSLAVEALHGILERFSYGLFGVPLAEGVMQGLMGDSVQLYQKLTDLRPADRKLASQFASVLLLKSSLERSYSKFDDAAKSRARAETYLDSRLLRDPEDEDLLLVRVRLGIATVSALEAVAKVPELLAARKKSVDDIVRFCDRFPNNDESYGLRVQRHWSEAVLARDLQDPPRQLEHQKKAVEAARLYYKARPENPSAFISLHTSLYLLGNTLETRGDFPGAEGAYLDLDKLLGTALAARPNDAQLKGEVAEAKEARAGIAGKLLNAADAVKLYREAEALRRELILLFPLNPNVKYRLANNLVQQARGEYAVDLPAAKKKLEEATAISGKLAKEFPMNDIFTIQNGSWREWLRNLNDKK